MNQSESQEERLRLLNERVKKLEHDSKQQKRKLQLLDAENKRQTETLKELQDSRLQTRHKPSKSIKM